jgi:TATA-box binding protein (TBP) (component of TFIID and TFIIIB)
MESTFSFIRRHVDIKKSIPGNPSWINVTTITMVTKVDIIPELTSFRSFMEKPRIGHPYTFIWTLSPTEFFNQVTIKSHDGFTNKSVKIFSNGSLQITGCTDPLDCERILEQIFNLMKECWDGFIIPPTSEFKIVMINTNFSLRHPLNLRNVYASSLQTEHITFFDPDRYSAVKIKISHNKDTKITCSVFSTGKVIMTGAKSLDQILDCYQIIVPILLPCILQKDKPNDEPPSFFLGYQWKQWDSFFSHRDIKNV